MREKKFDKIRVSLYVGLALLCVFVCTMLGRVMFQKSWEEWCENAGCYDNVYKMYERAVDDGKGTEEELYELMINNGFTTPVIETMLNDGYCNAYIPQLKEKGWIPQDFVVSPTQSQPQEQPQPQAPSQPTQQPSGGDPAGTSSNSNSNSNGSTSSTNDKNGNTAANKDTTTVDESVVGDYVVVEDTTAKKEAKEESESASEYKKGDKVSVTGQTNNGYYQIGKDGQSEYVKIETATTQESYENAWAETEKKDATCTEEGYVKKHNSLSNEDVEETLPKLKHKMKVTDRKKATCTKDGYVEETCEVCGTVEKKEQKATGHKTGEWKVGKKPGLFINGTRVKKCDTCGEVLESEKLPSKIHFSLLLLIIGAIAVIAGGCFAYFKLVKKNKISDSSEE